MANCQLPPPGVMVCTGNAAANWREVYTNFATASELTGTEEDMQAATFKTVMGKEFRQILLCLGLSDADKKPGKILEKREECFAYTWNILYKRYLFHSAQHQVDETINQYIIHLRHLAGNCKFGALHDEMLRDCLILGCRDKGARARLFREKECLLGTGSTAIGEATHEQLRDIGGEDSLVSAVHHKKSTK